MTKKEYIGFIRNSLPMVDQTSRFHHLQVEAAINIAVNSVFFDMYESNPKRFRKSMERYSEFEIATLAEGVPTGRYRTTLTYDVVDLPRKTGGILGIMQKSSAGIAEISTTTTDYVPVSIMEGEQLYGSESSLPGGVVGFSWSGAREIEYWGISDADAALGVYVRAIKQFKSYADTDNLLLPYGKNQQIIDKVREYLGVTPPKDTINDNSDINANG